jgi:glyoxylase-like metal-dependent hydrolase (beta-lactamase superfamily II)
MGRVLTTTHRLINRRMAIAEMGKAGLAIAVFGTAACSDGGADPTTTSPGSASVTTAGPATTTTTGAGSTTTGEPATTTAPAASSYQRVNLDFVSAYILYRGGEAALVDTGVTGSAAAIEAALGEAGLAWDSVGHVILTHKHPDHAGSVDEVMAEAAGAALYAGEADIPQIPSATAPQPVGDGDSVFGLEIIDSPGHTPGHICVLDSAAGILVTGDALNGTGGGVAPPDPSFSEDMTVAMATVLKLGGFSYEIALFGHGEPLLEGASAAVAALATG